MYAVIETGGKQYRVSEGDVVRVERLDGDVGSEVTLEEVRLIGGDDTLVGARASKVPPSAPRSSSRARAPR